MSQPPSGTEPPSTTQPPAGSGPPSGGGAPPAGGSHPTGGALGVGLAAAVAAVACVLPWYRVDLARIGEALPADAAFTGLGQGMNEMMQAFGGVEVTARGIDGWKGVVVLIAAVIAGAAALVESTGSAALDRSRLTLVAFGAAVVATVVAVIAWTDLGGPVGVHLGLVLVLPASAAAAVLAFRRLQQLGSPQ